MRQSERPGSCPYAPTTSGTRRSSETAFQLSRRQWLQWSTAGLVSASVSGWFGALAQALSREPNRKKACILLWMAGGPSQIDTFDPKPDHPNGGQFKPIATAVPGIQISETLPKIATHLRDLVLVRSMQTREADHGRGTLLMHTGRLPSGPVQYPSLGSFLSKELAEEPKDLPSYVAIAPYRVFSPTALSPGYLGPRYAPLLVGETNFAVVAAKPNPDDYENALRLPDLEARDVSPERSESRLRLLSEQGEEFTRDRPDPVVLQQQEAYLRAVRLMRTRASGAFKLEEEKPELRDAYGRNLFGQGCLLARRLIERGVAFVEVTLSQVPGVIAGLGWDTHVNNFPQVRTLCQVLDAAWSTLLQDLRARGLLENTLVIWMGEFGRTPRINNSAGRDHWANGWTAVLAGAGLRAGQVVGSTSRDGMEIKERPVSVADFLATVCLALGVDPAKQNLSNIGRPIPLVERNAQPIREVLP
ncbi:MAG: DUF1501 domain-containing protein [Gemmatales bacterium]|nr:DUF1501 domain-containing protein [Gemmatales bacterium]